MDLTSGRIKKYSYFPQNGSEWNFIKISQILKGIKKAAFLWSSFWLLSITVTSCFRYKSQALKALGEIPFHRVLLTWDCGNRAIRLKSLKSLLESCSEEIDCSIKKIIYLYIYNIKYVCILTFISIHHYLVPSLILNSTWINTFKWMN